jgi:alpha-L-fucosidase
MDREFYGFIHFGMNTFTGHEWGDGTESPSLFNPAALDCRQWARTMKATGMTGMVLTAKHHDGFCLWPTATTAHSVAASPLKGGKGDVVRECAEAAKEFGLAFGVYLSPWDRNSIYYGQGKAYDDFYCAQLRELCTNYGDLFMVWLDGAGGGGIAGGDAEGGGRQKYDFALYHALVRELQPNCAIVNCGPDARWIGNEGGNARAAEWSIVDERHFTGAISVPPYSDIDPTAPDLGSRQEIAKADQLIWYPAEMDTSIRPGWFYHKREDAAVRTADTLFDIYLGSVGGNANLILNMPPMPNGLFHQNDVSACAQLGKKLRAAFGKNLAEGAILTASAESDAAHSAAEALSPDKNAYWHSGAADGSIELRLDLRHPQEVTYIVLQEHTESGQQIEAFSVYAEQENAWHRVAGAANIGHKRILRLPKPMETQKLRIVIEETRAFASLQTIAIY